MIRKTFINIPGNGIFSDDYCGVYAFVQDNYGKIWVVINGENENSLWWFDRNADRFMRYRPKLSSAMAESFKKIGGILMDSNGLLCLSSYEGKGFFTLNPKTGVINNFR